MNFLRIVKKTKSKIDQAKSILSIYCLLSEISLSNTELTVLSYFMIYGINDNTKKLILDSQLLKSEDSLKNTISKLKKVGLIKKAVYGKDYTLNENINFKPDSVMGLLIKIDNS